MNTEEELVEGNIRLIIGRPVKILGSEKMEGLEIKGEQRVECEVIMSHFGYKLNDAFLSELNLKRDGKGFKFIVNNDYESSLSGLLYCRAAQSGT